MTIHGRKQIEQIATVLMGQSPPSSACSENCDGLSFIQGNAEFGERYPNPLLRCSAPSRIAEPGDLLLSVRAPVGELNQADQKLVIGRGLSAIRFPVEDRRYAWHAVKWSARELDRVAQGSTFVAVSRKDVETLQVQWVSDSERPRIAVVLDTVDAAIAKTQAVIVKLKQIRAGLLHDLLTCGLDHNGELRDPDRHPEQFKDSPLGKIPKEWSVTPLGQKVMFVTSGSRGWASYYSDSGPLFLRIGNLTREHINLRLEDIVRVQPPRGTEGARTRVNPGDILISVTADLGIIGVVPKDFEESYVNQHIALVRPSTEIVSRWVGRFLASGPGAEQFQRLNDTGAKAGLNLPAIESLTVALPSVDEQSAAAHMLDDMDSSIDHEMRQKQKLHNLKSGLMADLLTGRVRVPEHFNIENRVAS